MRNMFLKSFVLLVIFASLPLKAATVGLFKDARSYISDGMIKTLESVGHKTKIIDRKTIRNADQLKDLDVIYLPGGWNAVRWAGFLGRMNLVDFVAQGKGILAGAFRGGYARNCERPLFPQVGEIYRKANGSGVTPVGNSPLTKGVKPFYLSYFDHMVAKVGPKGNVFMVDSGGAPVGVSGAVDGGRYVIFGSFLGLDAKKELMKEPEKTLFLNIISWLDSAPEMSPEEIKSNRAAVEREFLIREKLLDYTLDSQGPDNGPGVLPQIKYELETPLESRVIRLKRAVELLSGADKKVAEKALAKITRALESMIRNYDMLLAQTINRIKTENREKLIADNPFFKDKEVIRKIDATDKPAVAKTELKNQIQNRLTNVWFDEVSKMTALFLYGKEYRDAIIPAEELNAEVADADKILKQLDAKIEIARQKLIADERKRDVLLVPALIKQSESNDAKIRQEAALELGRIADTRGIDALIRLLDDNDEKTRINAILALGWMKAGKAVPALIKMAADTDKWIRRRATQALGQIGDKRAVPVLLRNVDSSDFHTQENAILALGWLKAVEAVPRLIEIAKNDKRDDPIQRALMIDAIRALGHIGDKRALPMLKYWAEKADDFAAPRRSRYGRRIKDIYSTPISLGLQGYAEMAIKEIEQGGRDDVGIAQNDQLWRNHWFYGLKKNFNFLAGRALKVNQMPTVFKDEPEQLIDYLYDGGATGIHNAWGDQNMGNPAKRMKLVKAMENYDMRLIDVMPARGSHFTWKHPYKRPTPLDKTLEKAGAELVMMHYKDTPVFQGFWTEEDYPNVPLELGFENFLKNKYGTDYRKKLNIPDTLDLNKLEDATLFQRTPKLRKVFAEFVEWAGNTLMEWWREDQLFLSGFRKGCAFTFSNTVACRFTYIDVAGRAGEYIDAHGPESYESFGSDNDLMIELVKNGEARPVMCEFYNWYSPTDEHAERGFSQHLASGECFFNFNIYEIFKKPCIRPWSWSNGRWARAKKTFNKARKIKEYLAVPESAATVALVASERSKLLFYSKVYGERVPMPRRYYQNLSGMWSALRQSHIPVDAIWAESFTVEKLKKYQVLVLPDAKSLTNSEMKALRDWVKRGGVLIATGTSTLFDRWGKQRANYALHDVFGVKYIGHAAGNDPEKIDTWCFDSGKPNFKVNDEQFDLSKIRNYVYRDIKPDKSIGLYKVTNSGKFLDGMKAGSLCEYDMPLGYDQVKVTGAKVLAQFTNGDPAVTVNEFGKGLCYFWTPIYPGLCHVSSGWELTSNFKDFWPGVRELLASMVKGGLSREGDDLPVIANNCPKYVFINLKKQPEKKRLMVHLLNMDPQSYYARGISLNVRVPDAKKIRVYYPDTDTDIPFKVDGSRVSFMPRAFRAHDMIAISY